MAFIHSIARPFLPVQVHSKPSLSSGRRTCTAVDIVGFGSFVFLPTKVPSAPLSFSRSRVTPRAALHSGVGVSSVPDTREAVAYAVSAARAALPPGVRPSLAVVSATAHRDLNAVARLFHEHLDGVQSIGATSCNSVLTPDGPKENGVSALLLAATTASFASASAPMEAEGPEAAYNAGLTAAKQLQNNSASHGSIRAIYMNSSPGHEEHVLRAVHDVFGNTVPVVGGSAADNDVTGKWSIFHSGIAFNTGVALFSVACDVSAGAAMTAPYTKTAQYAVVTETRGRTVLRLNGRPAADVIYSFVGDAIENEYANGGAIIGQTSTIPMALCRTEADGTVNHISAHAAAINQPEGSVLFFAEAKVGDILTIMENENSVNSAAAAGAAIRSAYQLAKFRGDLTEPSCCLLVYCGGLSIAVGDALAGNMTDDFAAVAPKSAIGFTAFGEQGPLRASSGESSSNQHCNLAISMLLME